MFPESLCKELFQDEELGGVGKILWLTLRAANELHIPYIGYMVADFQESQVGSSVHVGPTPDTITEGCGTDRGGPWNCGSGYCSAWPELEPLKGIEDSLTSLTQVEWYSTLDLASWYWQVQMDECDCEKTAFTTPSGLYKWKKVSPLIRRRPQLSKNGLFPRR
ncbi:hypothetical protein MHYP_G00200550 [Metynnis hypsauchen]